VRTGLVIFGERPGPNTDPLRPLFPHTTTGAAARLIRMMGVTVSEYLRYTQRYNVFHDGEREMPTLEEARRRVAALHYKHVDLNPETSFLYLGKAAIGAAPTEYRDLQFLQTRGNVYLIPHPSGCNRIYNDVTALDRVSLLLRSIWRDSVVRPEMTPET
jgi:hypothetical protein